MGKVILITGAERGHPFRERQDSSLSPSPGIARASAQQRLRLSLNVGTESSLR